MKNKVIHYKKPKTGTKEEVYKQLNKDLHFYLDGILTASYHNDVKLGGHYMLLLGECLAYASIMGFPFTDSWKATLEKMDESVSNLMVHCAEYGCSCYTNLVLKEWNDYFDKKVYMVVTNNNHAFYCGVNLLDAIQVYLHCIILLTRCKLGIGRFRDMDINNFYLIKGVKRISKFTGLSVSSIKRSIGNVDDPYKVIHLRNYEEEE